MFRFLTLHLALFFAAALALVAPQSASSAEATSTKTNQQVFQVKGLVIEVKPDEKSVKIKHEEIPGYMQAMTMFFDVKDTNDLAGIEAGDPVTFRMTVTDTYGWIDQIRKTGPKRNDLPTTGPVRFVRDVDPLDVGDVLPEYHFTNQIGQSFSTKQFKGQALAINFLFTRCPFPTFCPQTARNFAETQQQLLALKNAPTNWHLLTISFDPEFDKPAVLKRYAERYNYDSNHWTFATGALIDITAIADQLGLKFWRDQNGGFDHNLRTVVIDPSSRIQTIFIGNEWTSEELVSELTKAAGSASKP
ncbi:MAG: SCO family protein [Verrucomicrobiota bacterium]